VLCGPGSGSDPLCAAPVRSAHSSTHYETSARSPSVCCVVLCFPDDGRGFGVCLLYLHLITEHYLSLSLLGHEDICPLFGILYINRNHDIIMTRHPQDFRLFRFVQVYEDAARTSEMVGLGRGGVCVCVCVSVRGVCVCVGGQV